MKKRILSMLLTIVMLAGLLPGTVWATECTHEGAVWNQEEVGHTDIHYLKCDTCGAALVVGEHSDSDNDSRCDVCGYDMD